MTRVTTRDWGRNRETWVRLLETRTGAGVATWVRRIRKTRPADERALRGWLGARGVTGYAQSLLVMECFGYPDFVIASADALIDAQYADRAALRPVLDAIVAAASAFGELAVQARKTYVSLVGPRRTFARVVPTTRTRVDLGLRLEGVEGVEHAGRLRPSRIHETMRHQIALTSASAVDREVVGWLRRAYDDNR
jgi:hypothetical protein